MFNKVFSFSTKKEEDLKLIQKLKIEASRTGRSFSWLVIQALREYEEKRNADK